jgi:hypothetical protein
VVLLGLFKGLADIIKQDKKMINKNNKMARNADNFILKNILKHKIERDGEWFFVI